MISEPIVNNEYCDPDFSTTEKNEALQNYNHEWSKMEVKACEKLKIKILDG